MSDAQTHQEDLTSTHILPIVSTTVLQPRPLVVSTNQSRASLSESERASLDIPVSWSCLQKDDFRHDFYDLGAPFRHTPKHRRIKVQCLVLWALQQQ